MITLMDTVTLEQNIGVLHYGTNAKYDGHWKKGLREGHGILIK